MNKQLSSLLPRLLCLSSIFICIGNLSAQTWQQTYPNVTGYDLRALDNTINANLKSGFSNAFFSANPNTGAFISLTPALTDCDLAPFSGDVRVSATEFFDFELTAAKDLKIRRLKLTSNTCALSQTVFDQVYDLPTAEAVILGNLAYNAADNTVFVNGIYQFNPVGPATQYQQFVKKINAQTGAQMWEYLSGVQTIAGPPNSELWFLQKGTQAGGIFASKSGISNGTSLLLIKLNGSGQVAYNKPVGGTFSAITGLTEHADGSILVRLYSASISGPGDNFRAIRWDANGNELFSIHAGLTLGAFLGGGISPFLTSFDADARLSNGDYLLVGKNTGVFGIPGAHLNRVSPTGTVIWTRFFPGLNVDFNHAIETFPDNGFLLGGKAGSNLFLMKTDANGNIVSNVADLALSVSASQPNPAQWSNTTITYTLTNTGTAAASGITVRAGVCETFVFGQNSGLVYANTNFQVSAGTYGQVSQAWNLPSLGPGQTATLSFTLFALTNSVRRVFGEVTGNYTDADSSPGNWVDCTPDEDDEAVVILNANNGCAIIVDLLGTTCNDNGTPDNPNDDYYFANIRVNSSGSACSSGFTWHIVGNSGSANYNTTISAGPLPASEFSSTVEFIDAAGPNTAVTGIGVISPGHCSGNGTGCFLSALSVNPLCNNNGTPNNPNDDTFTYEILVQKSGNCGTQWSDGLNSYVYGTAVPYSPAPIASGAFNFTVFDIDNPNSTATATVNPPPPCSSGGAGQIDLSLALQQLAANPAQYSNYPVKATLSNAGPQTATGVKVSFKKPNGVVYVGGNEFTASQGTFTPFGTEEWNVGSIPAGGSATLTVNYFLLNAAAPVAYAQVSAANETDADSQPNNGTPPTPVQDDEAATSGGGPTPQPDLTIADLQIPNASVAAGAVLNYNFDASNAGNAAVQGSFTIKSYISTDNVLSANDTQYGTITTGNYAAGFAAQNVAGASAIPVSLAAGSYFLIVKIDADNAVTESNENNNVVVKAFTVTTGGGTPDCNAITITPGQSKITIAGAVAPHVLIKVFKPNWQLAFECLDGTCTNPLVVSGLSAGNHFVEIKLLNASWGLICTKTQTVNVSNLGGGGLNALMKDNDRQRMAFDKIYPNPAQYFATLEVFSKEDQHAVFDFYDQTGRAVHSMEVVLEEGRNEVLVDVSIWRSGAYNVIGRGGSGMPAYGRFLKVWEE